MTARNCLKVSLLQLKNGGLGGLSFSVSLFLFTHSASLSLSHSRNDETTGVVLMTDACQKNKRIIILKKNQFRLLVPREVDFCFTVVARPELGPELSLVGERN